MQVHYESVVPFDFQGLQIRELTPERLETASIAEVEVPPGARHQEAQSRKRDKVYVCVMGMVSFQIAGQKLILKHGDVLLVPKDEWFEYHKGASEIARLVLLHVPPFDLASEEFLE